jgi:hypothetical protein
MAPQFLTSGLDVGEWLELHGPAALPQEKELAKSIGYQAGWAPEPV